MSQLWHGQVEAILEALLAVDSWAVGRSDKMGGVCLVRVPADHELGR